MKMDDLSSITREKFVAPSNPEPIDRRKSTRFLFSDKKTKFPIHIDGLPNDTAEIINVSINGISVRSKEPLPKTGSIPFQLHLSDDRQVKCFGRTIWDDAAADGFYYYGFHIYYFQEQEHQERFGDFIVDLEKISMKIDRRKEERRKAEISQKTSGRGKVDRRNKKPVFFKCINFHDSDDLINKKMYYFFRIRESGCGHVFRIKGKEFINFASNNYLGLSNHPEVREAAIRAIEKYGVGTGNSRFLTGTNDIHLELENAIARFRGADDCFVFSSGYNMNVGVVSTLLAPEDVAIVDEKVHLSVFDGCRLSGAEMLVFRHNDMKDLVKKLSSCPADKAKMIVTDGIFSMDGDLGHIDQIYEIAQKFNAAVYVDDAHANGVLGKTGRGSDEHFDLRGKIDIVVGTMSKAFGGLGGFVAAKKDVIKYIKHKSRTSIFSTGLPPAICASVIKAIELIEKNPGMVAKLWENEKYCKERLVRMGFDTGKSETPIIPVIVKNDMTAYKLTGMLDEKGICVSAFAYPAVKKNESRIRISLMSDHTRNELDYLLDQLSSSGKKLGILK